MDSAATTDTSRTSTWSSTTTPRVDAAPATAPVAVVPASTTDAPLQPRTDRN
jgi:hypothetical protein